MKAIPFLVLVFWISSWFSLPPQDWAIYCVAICIFGLLAVAVFRDALAARRWPSKILIALAIVVLVFGSVVALALWSVGTAAEAAILIYFVAGFAAYLLMLSKVIGPGIATIGLPALALLACWSWGSAIAMYIHLGAPSESGTFCILAPTPSGYAFELNSIWDMRLPQVVSSRTGPTGTVILDYHAILVAPNSSPEVYNWSKKRMRFQKLDLARNPYLPTVCP